MVRPSSILIVNIFYLYVIVKQNQTKSNKGFNFENTYFSQHLDDFRKSMQNTLYWLYQKQNN